ncbi:protein FAM177A1-like isoform X1 [Varroa jacobsoni]|uniref:protein FAM177A1-like isoform X1 n=1 Tax=Varroa jacobsoni TaxID=62625 RepID=UPI000BF69069|nr:protein FAM177A1-like isoform X1 [Varroa jacobsoni]
MSSQAVDTPEVQLGFNGGDTADAEKGISTKTPRRVIHFQDGDELEEYSTEEEGEVDQAAVSNIPGSADSGACSLVESPAGQTALGTPMLNVLGPVLKHLDITIQRMALMDWKSLPWSSYLLNIGVFGFLKAFKTLEYAGEVLSYKLGITTPKYQSEIEEAARMEAEEEEERKRAAKDASWGVNTIAEHEVSSAPSVTPVHRLHDFMPSPIASSTPVP